MTNQQQSVAYVFLLNMWIMKKVDEAYLTGQVAKDRLTKDEKEMILATPQINRSIKNGN